jgi:hypothetical protein
MQYEISVLSRDSIQITNMGTGRLYAIQKSRYSEEVEHKQSTTEQQENMSKSVKQYTRTGIEEKSGLT